MHIAADSGLNAMAAALVDVQRCHESPGFGLRPAAISDDGIHKLIKLAYDASLLPEEGRYPRFRICVPALGVTPRSVVAQFKTPVRLETPAELKKAAHCLATLDYALIVRESSGTLNVEGIVHLADDPGQPSRPEIFPDASPIALLLRIEAPGELRASVMDPTSILQLKGLHLQWRLLYEHLPEIEQWFMRLAKERWEVPTESREVQSDRSFGGSFGFMLLLRKVWSRVLSQSIERRHGGAFILADEADIRRRVPDFTPVAGLDLLASATEFWRSSVLANSSIDKPEFFERIRLWSDQRKSLLTVADTVSGLANVDGCVLLTPDLCVRGFAGKIDIADDDRKQSALQYEACDSDNRDPEVFRRNHGTRHRSAMDFVKVVPRSWAFVVSQDANLTIFRSTDTKYTHIPGLWAWAANNDAR